MSLEQEGQYDLIIEPGKIAEQYWRDLWRYRGLFFFLAWRDILVRYKQTVLGISWSVLRPLLAMIVFSIIFGKIAKMPTEADAPYPLLVFTALLPWQLFANGFTETSNSLISNSRLLTKVYFPRLIVPVSSIVVSLVDFLLSFFVLLGLMAWYQYIPSWRILALPLFLLLGVTTALAVGIWLATMNVKYRDFRYVVPFMVQFGLYISPVGFSSTAIPEKWRFLYSLNPMVGVIDGFRWAILGGESVLYIPGILLSIFLTLLLLVSGFTFFRRTERVFADLI